MGLRLLSADTFLLLGTEWFKYFVFRLTLLYVSGFFQVLNHVLN